MGTTDGQRTDRRLTDELALQREGSPTLPRKALLPLKRRFPHPIPTNTKKALMPDSHSEDSTYLPASAVEGAQMLRGHPPGTPALTRGAGPIQMLFSNRITSSRELAKSFSRQNRKAKLV